MIGETVIAKLFSAKITASAVLLVRLSSRLLLHHHFTAVLNKTICLFSGFLAPFQKNSQKTGCKMGHI
ncbi:MAG: hypothetical protein LPK19_06140 [Hymenobacteraceae bacterium]|nr:hypothetical protein [Hymenobacteraceae bacterium]MDX5395779.1 hypothetical protein [Hymenobacteraceae bacterium]MDX5511834.1 hypothetical protein [Hymenobacteraceae bacterium]